MPFKHYFLLTLRMMIAFLIANILIATAATTTSCCLQFLERAVWSGYQPPVIQDIYRWGDHVEFYITSFTASLVLAPLYLLYIFLAARSAVIAKIKTVANYRTTRISKISLMTLAAYTLFAFMAAAPWMTHQVSLNPADTYGIYNPATFYFFNIFPLYLFSFLVSLSFV